MTCVICKLGDIRPGTATITLERGQTALVVKAVPAQVCENCGEIYLVEAISAQVRREAEAAVQSGVQVDVRTYAAA